MTLNAFGGVRHVKRKKAPVVHLTSMASGYTWLKLFLAMLNLFDEWLKNRNRIYTPPPRIKGRAKNWTGDTYVKSRFICTPEHFDSPSVHAPNQKNFEAKVWVKKYFNLVLSSSYVTIILILKILGIISFSFGIYHVDRLTHLKEKGANKK